MRFFGLKTCDTCRKALKELSEAGHAPAVIDVRADGVPQADLAQIIARFGAGAINRSSATWRGLDEGARAADPAALIAAHPTLLKRPVVTDGDVWTQGWGPEARAHWLGKGAGAA